MEYTIEQVRRTGLGRLSCMVLILIYMEYTIGDNIKINDLTPEDLS